MVKLDKSIKLKNPERILNRKDGWKNLGMSSGGHPIIYKHLKLDENPKRILLIGGVHGNETEGVQFMHEFCLEFADGQRRSPFQHEILLIPAINPHGVLHHHRLNANQVDLNRNMPTKDWSKKFSEKKYYPGKMANSEPETKLLVALLASFNPHFVISFHSWKPLINYNGPALKFAEKMNQTLNMEVTGDIGYPTPGSLGTYTGLERGIPTITFEFPRGIALEDVYPKAKKAILDSFSLL